MSLTTPPTPPNESAPTKINSTIEDAAIEWVMQLERAEGRSPRRTTSPVDIESPPRVIEVKACGRSSRGEDLWLEVAQMEEARRNPSFYLYLVENVRQGDPRHFTLKILCGETLQRLLARAREKRHYEVPWPVAEYDATPNGMR